MAETGLQQAIERLDQALTRAERAAARPDAGFEALQAQHELLRGRVREAMSALDRLTGDA